VGNFHMHVIRFLLFVNFLIVVQCVKQVARETARPVLFSDLIILLLPRFNGLVNPLSD
jgi:hypothetical protein